MARYLTAVKGRRMGGNRGRRLNGEMVRYLTAVKRRRMEKGGTKLRVEKNESMARKEVEMNEGDLTKREANLAKREANLAKAEANLAKREANLAKREAPRSRISLTASQSTGKTACSACDTSVRPSWGAGA